MRPSLRLFQIPPPPLIRLKDASFRISQNTTPVFQNVNFDLPSLTSDHQAWAVLGTSSEERTSFLKILNGDLSADDPLSRTYPFLSSDFMNKESSHLRSPRNAIKYIGFDAERGVKTLRGAYASARYESRREITDFTLSDYLNNRTDLNPDEEQVHHPDSQLFEKILKDLHLESLLKLPVSSLSNGQTRRAQIAKALLQKPKLLLMNNPFIGLDPNTYSSISSVLGDISRSCFPRLVLSLNLEEPLPVWITHVIFLQKAYKIHSWGEKHHVSEKLRQYYVKIRRQSKYSEEDIHFIGDLSHIFSANGKGLTCRWFSDPVKASAFRRWRVNHLLGQNPNRHLSLISSDGIPAYDPEPFTPGEVIVEMKGVRIQYGDRVILGDYTENGRTGLWWKIRRGERWGLFGDNGSGKSTLTALITSDHPQAYSLPIEVFGRSRLASPDQPAISIFDLQNRIGVCSPELQAFFPKHLTVRKTLESAWAETPLSSAKLDTTQDDLVEVFLRWFQAELCPKVGPFPPLLDKMNDYFKLYTRSNMKKVKRDYVDSFYDPETLEWSEKIRFGELGHSSQRLLLFLRAIIKPSDLIVLDEPFSGLDAATIRKCQTWLAYGEKGTSSFVTLKQKSISSVISEITPPKFTGLTKEQALVFISHRREEIPGIVREWLCLPSPNSGNAARSGRFDGPLQIHSDQWNQVWNLSSDKDSTYSWRRLSKDSGKDPEGITRRYNGTWTDGLADRTYDEMIQICIHLSDWKSFAQDNFDTLIPVQPVSDIILDVVKHSQERVTHLYKNISYVMHITKSWLFYIKNRRAVLEGSCNLIQTKIQLHEKALKYLKVRVEATQIPSSALMLSGWDLVWSTRYHLNKTATAIERVTKKPVAVSLFSLKRRHPAAKLYMEKDVVFGSRQAVSRFLKILSTSNRKAGALNKQCTEAIAKIRKRGSFDKRTWQVMKVFEDGTEYHKRIHKLIRKSSKSVQRIKTSRAYRMLMQRDKFGRVDQTDLNSDGQDAVTTRLSQDTKPPELTIQSEGKVVG